MPEFSIILSLTLIIACDDEFHTEHDTKRQLHAEVNLNILALIQTYPMHSGSPVCLNSSI